MTCSGSSATVMSGAAFSQSSMAPSVSVIQPPIPSADLYLCATNNNATGEEKACKFVAMVVLGC